MKPPRSNLLSCLWPLLACGLALSSCGESEHAKSYENTRLASNVSHGSPQLKVKSVQLIARTLEREVRTPGEIVPYREVTIYPKVPGFVQSIWVDRGSRVSKGQTLIQIEAPEVDAQCGEAEGRVEAARSAVVEVESKIASLLAQRDSAQAKLAGDEALYKRVKVAALTEGAIAPSDIEQAEQKVAGGRANLQSCERLVEAARSQLNSAKGRLKTALQALSSAQEMKAYLTIRAPFDGVITERNVHEGSLVNSTSGSRPMLRLQESSRLRLVMPIPETAIAGLKVGTPVYFSVPAFTGKIFTARVDRIGHVLEAKTRSMTVEADIDNRDGALEPGMYPDVRWQMAVPYATIFAPSQAVATAGNGTNFVVRLDGGIAKPTHVICKNSMQDLIEIVGDVAVGDEIAITSLHELKEGSRVAAERVSLDEALKLSTKGESQGH